MKSFLQPLAILSVLILFASCSPRSDLGSGTDSTAMTEDTSAYVQETTAGSESSDPGAPQDGVWVFQGIWLSQAFDDEFTRTQSIDSALEADPFPFAYFDFTGGDSYLGLFDFTMYLANGAPEEELVWSSFDTMDSQNHVTANVERTDKNPRGITRMEALRKNDYDKDADGEVDDLETLNVTLYRGDKVVASRMYYKTYRSPDEIAHAIQLTGSYVDAKGNVYTFEPGRATALPERYKHCSEFLAMQECWHYSVFRLTGPDMIFDYWLQADEAGNDLLMMGEDKGFAYVRKGDSLTLHTTSSTVKLVAKK
jgi:hypothetical protein